MASKKIVRSPKTPEEAIALAHRLYRNAKELLSRSPVQYDLYQDTKLSQEACGTAYLAVVRAIEAALLKKGVSPDALPTSFQEMYKAIRRLIPKDGKLTAAFITVYDNLHLFGYYKGGHSVGMIKEGFEKARLIVETLAGPLN